MSQLSRKALASRHLEEYAHFFRCPLCHQSMSFDNQSIVCSEGHSYDLAKKGYIHMLAQSVQTKYDKELFQSRRRIAESGFFTPLIEAIGNVINQSQEQTPIAVFDAGCGEGSHLAQIQEFVSFDTIGFGADISKEGVQLAANNESKSIWLVADLANCPLASEKFPYILNILSPSNYSEFSRMLTDDGLLMKVVPNQDYLKELREFFYEEREAFDNEKTIGRFEENFDLIKIENINYRLTLQQPLLSDLVKMTPLSWSANEKELKEIHARSGMDITVDVSVLIGRKKSKK
ncbi:putative RNA methyltransferase [Bacillus sp. FJAT-50079]|uniref:putative RNA methyltransferase n=1 Tax=Bacillus sp. FJAT-50079 TaxID=2833577 RepID=UPI001BC9FCFC|nr:methyltransferase domain-containing protein [Bacillus sp. FJAT-50079]MBS4210224.1 methyltransferase domain-containing protein [Bacillus sp. FJAT-50079]